jgi:hypothetical protein
MTSVLPRPPNCRHSLLLTTTCQFATTNDVERETGIEPATNSLEGCDSTTELLPPSRLAQSCARRYGGQAR